MNTIKLTDEEIKLISDAIAREIYGYGLPKVDYKALKRSGIHTALFTAPEWEITNESDTKTIAFDDKFDVLKQNEEVKEDVNNIEEKIENNEELKEIVVKPLTPNKLRKPVKVSPVAPKHIPLKDLVDDSEVIDLESSDKND